MFRGGGIMNIKYIELKTGFSDDGPAWIGYVRESRSGCTIYFNGHAFQRYNGVSCNYYDIESGDDYWISGVKKHGTDRHWAGKGKIIIDRKAVEEYLKITGKTELDKTRFVIQDIDDAFPVDRVRDLLNKRKGDSR